MRIGFDLAQASTPLTGCGWYAHSLLAAMAGQSGRYEFLAYRHFAEWINEPTKLHPLPSLPTITDPFQGQDPESVATVWQNALKNGQAPGSPELVHSTSFQAPLFYSSKLVFTVFDLSFWVVPEYTTDRIRLACQRGVLDAVARADGLIFISEHSRREFDHLFPHFRRKQNLQTIVTPLASRWTPTNRATQEVGDYWLFVGTLEPRKNLNSLLDAYERYAAREAEPKPLWIAGANGWESSQTRQAIERLAAKGLAKILGYLPDEQLPDLYSRAHALVLPSWYEGFGMPVLEAMSLACPVICSDRASLPEAGGDAVHYIDPASPDSLALALKRLHHDVEYRRTLVGRGATRAQLFAWEKTAKLTLAFYERVIHVI